MRACSRQWAKRAALLAMTALMLALFCSCATTQPSESQSSTAAQTSEAPAVASEESAKSVVANPIDFASLQAENGDIYAWLRIPDTAVDVAVLQSEADENYYLTHDMYGNDYFVGAAYSQSMNNRDFSDPVTLIYGHTFEEWQTDLKDEMFGTLHNFEDPNFFATHDTFYIYTPDRILTYRVVSAFEFDNRHILKNFDFSEPAVLQSFFDTVTNPESMVQNVREGIKLKAGKSKIVILSTCTRPADDAKRYLVAGVLVDEQPTI